MCRCFTAGAHAVFPPPICPITLFIPLHINIMLWLLADDAIHDKSNRVFYEADIIFLHQGEDIMYNLPSRMDCSIWSWSWWEGWLCIWLFPWRSKWQKAALGSLRLWADMVFVCCTHWLLLAFFEHFVLECLSSLHSVICCSRPFSEKRHLVCESSLGFTLPLGVAGLSGHQAAVMGCVRFWKVLISGSIRQNDKSVILISTTAHTLSTQLVSLRRKWCYSAAVAQMRGSVTES